MTPKSRQPDPVDTARAIARSQKDAQLADLVLSIEWRTRTDYAANIPAATVLEALKGTSREAEAREIITDAATAGEMLPEDGAELARILTILTETAPLYFLQSYETNATEVPPDESEVTDVLLTSEPPTAPAAAPPLLEALTRMRTAYAALSDAMTAWMTSDDGGKHTFDAMLGAQEALDAAWTALDPLLPGSAAVTILHTWDRHGDGYQAFASEAAARAALVSEALEGLEKTGETPANVDALSDEEVIDLYYADSTDDGYWIGETNIEGQA